MGQQASRPDDGEPSDLREPPGNFQSPLPSPSTDTRRTRRTNVLRPISSVLPASSRFPASSLDQPVSAIEPRHLRNANDMPPTSQNDGQEDAEDVQHGASGAHNDNSDLPASSSPPEQTTSSTVRASRLSRVRHSFSTTIPSLLHRRPSMLHRRRPARYLTPSYEDTVHEDSERETPSRNAFPRPDTADNTERSSPRIALPTRGLLSDPDFDHSSMTTPAPSPFLTRPPSPHPRPSHATPPPSLGVPPLPPLSGLNPARAPATTLADRLQSFAPEGALRSLVRRRRSPPRTEDNAALLARMLAVAAAATAASLMGGNSEEAVQNLRNANGMGIDGDDGTFDRFLQTLRSGRLAQRLGAHALEQANGDGQNNGMAFFRVFRFTHAHQQHQQQQRSREQNEQPRRRTASLGEIRQTTTNTSTASHGIDPLGVGVDSDAGDNATDGPTEGRMVPVLMIGIRSLPESANSDGNEPMPSFLDALTNFPAVNMNVADDATPDEIANEASTQASSSRRSRRRSSMGGLGFFSGTREGGSRRSQAASPVSSRPLSEIGPSSTGTSTPLTPYPPPTTPSSRPLSALSSGTSSPSRRTSLSSSAAASAGVGSSSTTPRREQLRQNARTALESTAEEPAGAPRPPRSRRLSESDFMRYGSGSARRNGVVEPDNSAGNRSWIIYVLGGSYPENHPILMAPSLFTDSPTYEDMMLLSSMLGPVKPPVASTEDIASAGGLVSFEIVGDDLVAVPEDGSLRIIIPSAERCLVCLCGYDVSETGRKLASCGHLFHQECIDQWLTTGRNSCPLCRRQGVEEKSPSTPVADGSSGTPPSPTAPGLPGFF